jgi:hypothetical protein
MTAPISPLFVVAVAIRGVWTAGEENWADNGPGQDVEDSLSQQDVDDAGDDVCPIIVGAGIGGMVDHVSAAGA